MELFDSFLKLIFDVALIILIGLCVVIGSTTLEMKKHKFRPFNEFRRMISKRGAKEIYLAFEYRIPPVYLYDDESDI